MKVKNTVKKNLSKLQDIHKLWKEREYHDNTSFKLSDKIIKLSDSFCEFANKGDNYKYLTKFRIGDIVKSKNKNDIIKYAHIKKFNINMDDEGMPYVVATLAYIDSNGKKLASILKQLYVEQLKVDYTVVDKVGNNILPFIINIKEIKELSKKKDRRYMIIDTNDDVYVISINWWSPRLTGNEDIIKVSSDKYVISNKKGCETEEVSTMYKIKTKLQYDKLIESLL